MTVNPSALNSESDQGLARAIAYAAMVISVIVLIGWITDVGILSLLRSGDAAMVPSTAILLLVSASTIITGLRRAGDRAKLLLILVVVTIASIDQWLFIAGMGGIDHLVLGDSIELSGNRMSTMTAICFGLFSGANLIRVLAPSRSNAFTSLATIGLVIGLVGIIGFVFDANALYSVSVFSSMSIVTSIGFALIFVAIMLQYSEENWTGVFFQAGPGSVTARRFVIPLVGLPILLSYFALRASDAGLLNTNFRLSLIAIFMMLSLFGSMLFLARQQNASHAAQQDLVKQLRQTVADRDLLLSEVYHRVKNNLQQINALLFLQSQNLKSKEATDALRAMSGRVESLGIVQTLLLESPARTNLNANEFLSELCERLEAGLGGGDSFTEVQHNISDRTIDLDAAITMGLLVNELVSNAFKYAFDADQLSESNKGIITVSLVEQEDGAKLSVSDNGKGLPDPSMNTLPKGGSGSSIVTALASQLGGQAKINGSNGLSISIMIPNGRLEKHV